MIAQRTLADEDDRQSGGSAQHRDERHQALAHEGRGVGAHDHQDSDADGQDDADAKKHAQQKHIGRQQPVDAQIGNRERQTYECRARSAPCCATRAVSASNWRACSRVNFGGRPVSMPLRAKISSAPCGTLSRSFVRVRSVSARALRNSLHLSAVRAPGGTMDNLVLMTTLGPLRREGSGDDPAARARLRGSADARSARLCERNEAEDVVRLMAPEIEKIKALGVTALVECTTGGVGRRADFDLAVSQATGFPIVVPTGNYREPWIPEWVRTASEAELEAWMLRELTERFDEADYQGRLDQAQRRRRRHHAARGKDPARRHPGGDRHRRGDRQPHDQGPGGDGPARYHRSRGRAGRPLHFDPYPGRAGFRSQPRGRGARCLDRVRQYRPGRGRGDHRADRKGAGGRARRRNCCSATTSAGTIRRNRAAASRVPIRICREVLLPKLKAAGIDEATLTRLTHDNPFNAFARPGAP